jgi:outer membrane usher protein FimD/PapC
VVFSPETGTTMALIEAKDAAGAMLPGSPGTRIDSNGYAILPYLRPYRINSVEIDPKGSNDDVAFDRTVAQVVPWEGSVVKVSFDTTCRTTSRYRRARLTACRYRLPPRYSTVRERDRRGGPGQHDVYQRCQRAEGDG